jgi:hypothetical protein
LASAGKKQEIYENTTMINDIRTLPTMKAITLKNLPKLVLAYISP